MSIRLYFFVFSLMTLPSERKNDCDWIGNDNSGVTIIECKSENGKECKPKLPNYIGLPYGCTCKVACTATRKDITGLEFELNTCTLNKGAKEGETNYIWKSKLTGKETTTVLLEKQCDIMRTIIYKEQKIGK